MKTRLFFSAALVLLTGTAFAQYRDEMSAHLTRDEVPSVVQKSLEKKIEQAETDGQWTLFYHERTIEGSHDPILNPEFYCYSYKLNGERMEYLFRPDGSLYEVKERSLKGSTK